MKQNFASSSLRLTPTLDGGVIRQVLMQLLKRESDSTSQQVLLIKFVSYSPEGL